MISEGGRSGVVEAPDGGFRASFREADDTGLTPEHLFAGAYAACYYSALAGVVERAHTHVPGLTVVANVLLEESDHGGANLAVELRASMPGVDRSDGEHWMHLAHTSCPYSKALRGRATVSLTLD